jgi:hypothetical protein
MNTLSFHSNHRPGKTLENGSTLSDRKYFDFIISGQSLAQLLKLTNNDQIGALGWTANREYENKLINEFLGNEKPELESGRTSFYVCPECGDIGCGAITATIEVTDNSVLWKEFGFENNSSVPDFEDYKEIGPFRFDKTDYFQIFETLRASD